MNIQARVITRSKGSNGHMHWITHIFPYYLTLHIHINCTNFSLRTMTDMNDTCIFGGCMMERQSQLIVIVHTKTLQIAPLRLPSCAQHYNALRLPLVKLTEVINFMQIRFKIDGREPINLQQLELLNDLEKWFLVNILRMTEKLYLKFFEKCENKAICNSFSQIEFDMHNVRENITLLMSNIVDYFHEMNFKCVNF
jgi:hypothetical protein